MRAPRAPPVCTGRSSGLVPVERPGYVRRCPWDASRTMISRVLGACRPSAHAWQRRWPRAFKGIAVFSGVACTIVAPTVAHGQQPPGGRTGTFTPRSAYHRAAEVDSNSFLTNRQHMLAIFAADVRRMRSPRWPLQIAKAPAGGGRALDVRILQWNVRAAGKFSHPRCPRQVCVLLNGVPLHVCLRLYR